MKRVFLVDDEAAVREGVSNYFEWEKEGFDYCGDAPDGEVAIPLIEKLNPDIVITDIKMPFMDGLELSRVLRKKMPWIKIIILSGHDEFEYAREALRIQVTEYCLKPFSSNDLLEVLRRVSQQIDKEKMKKEEIRNLKSQAFQTLTHQRETFLNALCEGSYSTSEVIKQSSSLDIDIIANYYCTLIIESEREIVEQLEWIKINFSTISFNRKSKEIVFIVKGDSSLELEEQMRTLREQLISLSNQLNKEFIFGIGKVKNRIQGISISFGEAEEEKSYSKIIHKYSTREYGEGAESRNELHYFNRKDLIEFLKFGDKQEIPSFSKKYSSYLKEGYNHTPFFVYYFLTDFTLTITHYIKERETDHSNLLQKVNTLEIKTNWIRDYKEVLDYMEEVLHVVIDSRNQLNSKYGNIIEKAKDYIKANYANSELSLQDVASNVNVSPAYLSSIFSQQTDQTLIEYITMTRMEMAKELLRTTNYKTYEIAYKVGYNDSHYFCNLFKKITGKTTKEYKSQGQSVS